MLLDGVRGQPAFDVNRLVEIVAFASSRAARPTARFDRDQSIRVDGWIVEALDAVVVWS
jgi:hypothetical protein